ncbi:MAG: 23S rRNA (pseudouridine(1915)-N(3))-methyltransferase RlmH [Acidobacteriaceae bacterium]|nr:23S rRNA (pseudouridine(1915)-N(3))-methyltransferase RlmH [Acidobacteriaceae bacterium]
MTITLAVIWRKGVKGEPARALVQQYMERASKLFRTQLVEFASEEAFLSYVSKRATKPGFFLLKADSRGKLYSSEELSELISDQAIRACSEFVLAIGPAEGWMSSTSIQPSHQLSFGRITLPHELAAAIAAEQIYRALCIQMNHPYHKA